jgi:hypothetical protein
MRVEKLPFTAYDIVGYFLPGATLLTSIVFFLFPDILTNLYEEDARKMPVAIWLVIGILATTISYALGYCIALIASMGIEDPIIAVFRYPSEFLVRKPNSSETDPHHKAPFLWKIFLLHYLLTPPSQNINTLHPEVIPSAPGWRGWVRRWVRDQFEDIFVKKLCDPVIDQLDKKLKQSFAIERDTLTGAQWFNLVQYYVMNNNSPAFLRMYNYMTIYGFCRNLSAALYCSLFFLAGGTIIHFDWVNLSWTVVLKAGFAFLFMLALSGMLAANFAKFYRRYSQEAVYAFVTMKDSDKSSGAGDADEAQNSAKNKGPSLQAIAS